LSRGCNVLFADLKLRKEAEDTVKEHTAPKNTELGRAVFQETDVSEWKHLERMFKATETEFGSIDIVVPGAGVYEPVFPPSHSLEVFNLQKISHGPISGIHQAVLNRKIPWTAITTRCSTSTSHIPSEPHN
jgi:NAD(P)-dependent dehydrogenase (short-subunit alcohol dehydrogenase family)